MRTRNAAEDRKKPKSFMGDDSRYLAAGARTYSAATATERTPIPILPLIVPLGLYARPSVQRMPRVFRLLEPADVVARQGAFGGGPPQIDGIGRDPRRH
jgi:hypothetical protein